MKFIFKTMIIGMSLFIISCNNDDDSTPQHAINGSWNLKNVSGGITGVNLDYTKGEVIWIFNSNTNSLNVENNIITTGPKNIHAGLISGTYSYEIKEENKKEVLYINNTKRGTAITENNSLCIDDNIAADGFLTKFDK